VSSERRIRSTLPEGTTAVAPSRWLTRRRSREAHRYAAAVAIAFAWQEIRAFRAAPPGLAADDDDRRATFDAALRQAQELAEASAAAGYAAKPLPLFYALSQAGRAIAASRLTGNWKLSGHGLSARQQESGVLDSVVEPQGGANASFPGVARALTSPGLVGAAELGALWATNPDLTDVPIRGDDLRWPRALPALLGGRGMLPGPASDLDPGQTPLTTGGSIMFNVPIAGELASDVQDALAPYSTLREMTPMVIPPEGAKPVEADQPVQRYSGADGISRVIIGAPADNEMSQQEYWDLQEQYFSFVGSSDEPPHQDVGWALPDLAGAPAPHPLLLWWALLLGLSSFARYEPAAWTGAIDLSSSVLAVSLERVLDIAEERVPIRILDALQAGE
jgi:hypothetical protein